MLSDMVLAAINEALRAAQELAATKLAGSPAASMALGGCSAGCGPARVLRWADRPVSTFAPPVQRLVTELSKLPGIGNRTAQRLAFHILRASDEDASAFAEAIREVKERIGSARCASTSPTSRAVASASMSGAIAL